MKYVGLIGLAVAVFSVGIVLRAQAAPTATGRINVTATLTSAVARELGRPGRRSNATEQAWRITNRYGKTVGRMLLGCRWIVPRARMCVAELQMPLGKIVAAGSSPTPFEGEYAVVGGTGVYRGGGGSMLFIATGLHKQVLLVTITP